jgi:Host cell surface-exposed lipoprotein
MKKDDETSPRLLAGARGRTTALYAVDHINVDWNEQAARAAKSCLESQAFSRKALIEQLSSDYGDGFTHAQAVYGVNKAY